MIVNTASGPVEGSHCQGDCGRDLPLKCFVISERTGNPSKKCRECTNGTTARRARAKGDRNKGMPNALSPTDRRNRPGS